MDRHIFFSPDAAAELEKLDKSVAVQIMKKVKQLRENPELGKPLSNVLKNKKSLHIGKYRVIYSVQGKDVIIARVAHREEAYG
ncbi:ParE toxin of type II toxin-antitoxin system, parDE [Candidatus Burarchaeum australiense]|nr:ParE toxin of type II toxin-antitoxin system, parDE [Candidatus Burarchaeum australiense]